MNIKSIGLLGLLAVLQLTAPSEAHHSFPAHYDAENIVTIEGKVTAFQWRNPHSFLIVESTGSDGNKVVWACEWNNTIAMGRAGLSAKSFSPGDTVTVRGNPAWDKQPRLRLVNVKRPADGLEFNRAGGVND